MELNDFKDEVGSVMEWLKIKLQDKLKMQGYGDKKKSKLQKTMEYEIKNVATLLVAMMYMEDYYVYVEYETPAESIPFGGKKTGAKVSKYIQALFRYWRRKRGLGKKEALRASFALANVHKKRGRPSPNSFKYSKDGSRTGFIETTLAAVEERVFKILERKIGNNLELTFTKMLNDIGLGIKLVA